MLSSRMDDQSRTYVVNRFTASLPTTDPLNTFYTMMLGRIPSVVRVRRPSYVHAFGWAIDNKSMVGRTWILLFLQYMFKVLCGTDRFLFCFFCFFFGSLRVLGGPVIGNLIWQ